MAFSFSTTSRARMRGIDERLIRIAERAIVLSKIDFGIPAHGGLRTAEEQAQLYADAMGVNLGPLVYLTEISSSTAPLAP